MIQISEQEAEKAAAVIRRAIAVADNYERGNARGLADSAENLHAAVREYESLDGTALKNER